ncbi:MAG: DUF1579 family protein [Candidatus Eisenbacteria bacterium]
MRGVILTLCATVTMSLVAVCGFQSASVAQDGMPAMGAPAEIKALAGMDGTYDVTIKMKMGPDAPWTESKGKATVEMVLDGCAQKMSFQGEMMGMPFSGLSYLVYNRETKQWQTTWIDNMMGSMSYYTGMMENGVLTVSGVDHMMGMEFHTRAMTYDMAADGFKWKMEQSMDGGKTYAEAMQMEYKRVH